MSALLSTLPFFAVFTFYDAFVWLVFLAGVFLCLANAAGKFPQLWIPLLLVYLFVILLYVGPR